MKARSGRSITIIGGGLAGLTLGIGLQRRGVATTLVEAGHYPRHRVCGEFISGRGLSALTRLGLLPLFKEAGAVSAETAAFFAFNRPLPVRALPVAALCLSRYRMDELLAREYQRLGGELRLGRRWRGTMTGEGLVRAAGRMARPLEHGWRWMGVKAHARDLKLEADLEMHLLPHGYVGLCRLAEGRVNVCGLFRRRAGQEQTSTDREEFLRGPAGSSLRRRLATAVFDPGSVCSVAGLSLQPHRAGETDECRVGDALTMIPPITGNGMSMAFESAELAAETLAAYTRGEKDWLETVRSIARRCDACFAGRLAWAAALQKLMFCPALLRGPAAMLLRAKPVWRLLYARTR